MSAPDRLAGYRAHSDACPLCAANPDDECAQATELYQAAEKAMAEDYDRRIKAPMSEATAHALRDRLASGDYPRRTVRSRREKERTMIDPQESGPGAEEAAQDPEPDLTEWDCVDGAGQQYPDHEYAEDAVECRRCGAEI